MGCHPRRVSCSVGRRHSSRTTPYYIYKSVHQGGLIGYYPENVSDCLLPIIRNTGTNERYAYRNVGYDINRNLKTIAKKVEITIPLTLYVARHSRASAAKAKGMPLSVVSEGMGHDSEATAQIYLASLETSVVDKANSLILKSL